MSKQLEDLMKRAGEARSQERQRELDRKFFAWLEDTFNINKCDKTTVCGKSAAIVDNALIFVRENSEDMNADVYSKCRSCLGEIHNFGTVRNLEELGECLRVDEQGNFPIVCQYLFLGQIQTRVSINLSEKADKFNCIN